MNKDVYENINKTDKVRKLEKRLKQAQRKLSKSYNILFLICIVIIQKGRTV